MKPLILCLSLIFLISCKEKNKETTHENLNTEVSAEQTTPKEMEIADSKKIIPGERLGSLVLNENSTAVFDSLGKPDFGDASMGKAVSTWGKNPDAVLTLYTTMKMGVEDFSRIKAIRSLSSDYRTEDNLGVNSTIAELKRYYRLDYAGKFAYNGKHYSLYTTNKGIAFEIGMNQKCHGILLYNKNTDITATYLPIYADFDFKEEKSVLQK